MGKYYLMILLIKFRTCRITDPSDLPNNGAGIGMYARVNNLKLIDPNLKTSLSFGGGDAGPIPFENMTATANRRSIFINSAIAFVRQYCFDGIDIDYEFPQNDADKQNFANLLQVYILNLIWI